MATFITDFSEYTLGQAPPDWSSVPGDNDSTMNILADPDSLGLGGKILEISRASGTSYGIVSWDDVSSHADVELLALIKGVGNITGCSARFQEGVNTGYNYYIDATDGYTSRLTWHNNGSQVAILQDVATALDPVNSWTWVRLKISGSLVQGKMWTFDTVEPSTWYFEKTDTNIPAAGLIGVMSDSSARTPKYCAYFAVTDGDTSPAVPNAPVPTPQIFSTNFSEYETDVAPPGWTKTWSTRQWTRIIESGEAINGGKLLEITKSSPQENAIYTWDILDAIPHNRDFEALVLWKSSHVSTFGVGVGGRYVDSNNLIRFYPADKDVTYFDGTGRGTNRGSTGPGPGVDQTEWTWLRTKAEGITLHYKHWRLGDSEPAEWISTTFGTDAIPIKDGKIGIWTYTTIADPYYVAYFSVGLGGLSPTPPTTFITDFSEYTLGQAPPDWSSTPWGSTAVGNIVADTDNLGLGGQILELTRPSGSSATQYAWNKVGSPYDVEALVLVKGSGGGSYNGLNVRATGPSEYGYQYYYQSSSGKVLRTSRQNNGSYTNMGDRSVNMDLGNTWTWMRIRAVGTDDLRTKSWAFGAIEPDSWYVETVSSHVSNPGEVGLWVYTTTDQPRYCAYFAVDTTGDNPPAVPAATLPTPQVIVTDFSEYTIGQAPPDWSSTPWNANAVGNIIADADGLGLGGKVLELTRSSGTSASTVFSWDVINAVDSEILALVKGSGGGSQLGVHSRAVSGTTGYGFYFQDSGDILRTAYRRNGTYYNIEDTVTDFDIANAWTWMRFRVVGTTVQSKAWTFGAEEPSEWLVDVQNYNVVTPEGKVGLRVYTTADAPRYCAYFAVGLGGASPDAPSVNPVTEVRNTLTKAQVLVGSSDGKAILRNTLTKAQVLIVSPNEKAILRNTLLKAQVLLGSPIWAPIEEDPIINGAGLGMPGEATTVHVDYFALSAGEEAQTQPPTFFTDPATYSYRFGISNSNFNSSEKELIHLGLVKYSVKLWYSQRRGYTNSTYGSYIALLKGDTELGEWFEEAVWDDRRPRPVTDYDWHWAGIENEPWPRDFFGVWAGHMLYGPGIAAGAIDFTLHFPEYDIKVGRSPNLFMRVPRLSYTGVGAGKFYNTSLADGFWSYTPADATKWLGYNTKTNPWPFPHPEGMAIFVPDYPVSGEVSLYRHIDLRTYEFFNEDFVSKALENAATAFFTFNVGSAVGSAGTSTVKAGFLFLDDADQIIIEDLRDVTPSAGSWSTIDFEAIEFPSGVRQILMGYVLPAGTSPDICFGYMELKLGLNGVLLGIVPYPENEFCFNIPYVEDDNGNVICNQYDVAFFGEDKAELVYPLQTVTVCPVRPTQPGPPGEPDPPPPPVDLGDPVPLNPTIEVRDGKVFMEADHHPNWTGPSMWVDVIASKETDPYNLTKYKLVHSGFSIDRNPAREISFTFAVGPYGGLPPDDYFNNWWDYNHWWRYYTSDGDWFGPWSGGVTGSPTALDDPPPGVKYQFIKAIAYFTAASEASAVRLTWTAPENISDYAISRVYYSRNSKEPQLLAEVFNSEYLHIYFSRQPTRFFYWVAYVSTQGVEGPRAGPIEGLTGRAEDFEDINRIDRKYWSVSDPLPVANWGTDHYDDISNISSAGLYYAEVMTDPPDVEQYSYYGKGCIALQASDTVDVSINLKKTIRLGDTSYLLVSFAVMHGFATADTDIIDISLVTDQGEITALRTAYWQGSAWQPLQTPPEYGEWIVGYSVFNVRTGDDLVPDPQIAGLKISLNPSAADEWLFIDGLSVFKTYGEYAEPPTPDTYIDPPGSTQITVLNADKYIKPGAINTQHLTNNSVSRFATVSDIGPIPLSSTDPTVVATLIMDITEVTPESRVVVTTDASSRMVDSPVQIENVTINLKRDVDGGGFVLISSQTIAKEGKVTGPNFSYVGHDAVRLHDSSPVNGIVTYQLEVEATHLTSLSHLNATLGVFKR